MDLELEEKRNRGMNMDKDKREIEKKDHSGKRKLIAAVLTACILVVIGIASRYAIAKYYAYKAEQGITVASAFYFNSDKLVKPKGGAIATEDAVKEMVIDDIPVTVNSNKWTGGDCLFTVEIRNYDNNLLYNEAGLDIGYEIYFRLVGTPQGAEYTITYGDETKTLTMADQLVKYTGSLNSGSPYGDTYRIHITTSNVVDTYDNDNAAKVLVVAYPTSPDYIKTGANKRQENLLYGVFQGVLSKANMTIESKQFTVQSEKTYQTNWKNAVEDVSGLIYNIRTGGDALIDDSNSIRQEARVRWNSQYLQISEYEIESRAQSAYKTEYQKEYQAKIALLSDEEKKDPGKLTDAEHAAETAAKAKYDDIKENWIHKDVVVNGVTWYEVTIETLPNTEINMTFYKTETFMNAMKSDTMTKKIFEEELADAYIPQQS